MTGRKSYHHGNLHQELLEEATRMIGEQGVDGISMRALAERVGVSRTAAYHHFKDKNALLCAIAEQGFEKWQAHFAQQMHEQSGGMNGWLKAFVHAYLDLSWKYPEEYDLMFGRPVWKNGEPTESLRAASFACFQHYVDLIRSWQDKGKFSKDMDGLRLAQVSWSMLHGMSRLLNDGIYLDRNSIDAMSDSAVEMILAAAAV
ncbi:TetR/AcrR family transcriptional regulator [Endozoicomonas sp. GU-1]|uniref:TetR/AcrR family transcriptional regulator n=1 Tax=Endozoicomonas sp. GU-1 TaxID=3009078 RepID=UPI0022B45222|nr:TetR/AcrR family transcriptional regulator [Endozoicomonas sp. GU-1]WBA83301.1 TetR/AcrR family transcriptional regulator [Endozoicomonas sp. GU-1]WBA86232.1 TetR/AcrR family transcriptional regulator [Endozoicomonas sp. GU-1]